MDRLIIGFEKETTADRVAEMLKDSGITYRFKCRSASEVIRAVNKLGGGVVVCGFKFADMTGQQMAACLDESVPVLMLASPQLLHLVDDSIYKLPFPVTKPELAASLRMLIQLELRSYRKTEAGRDDDKEIIRQAKEKLMARNNMDEEHAYRYLQKISMNAGVKMVETAKQILAGTLGT